ADESGRGTEEPRDGVLLAVLAHIERDHGVFVVEQELGERLGQLGLTDTRGAGEDERTGWPLRVFESGARTADGARQRRDGFRLADDTLVQRLLHEDETRRLLLGELEHRNAGGCG